MTGAVTLPPAFAVLAFLAGLAGMAFTAWLAPRRRSAASVALWTGFLLLLVASVTSLGDAGPLESRWAGYVLLASVATLSAGSVLAVRDVREHDRRLAEHTSELDAVRRESDRLTTLSARLDEENRELRRKLRTGEDQASGANALLESALVRHKRAAETAAAEARAARAVVEGAGDGIAVVDRETLRVESANASLGRMAGSADLAGRTLPEILGGAGSPADLLRGAREPRLVAAKVLRKDGSELPVEVAVGPTGDDGRIVVSFRDATARAAVDRDHDAVLSETRARLDAAEQAVARLETQVALLDEEGRRITELSDRKDHYLSSVSHELRTPLASIRSFSEILLQHGESDAAVRREFLEIIQKESERLTRLVNNVLDLARIEAGAAKLLIADFDARQAVHESVRAMQGFASERGVEIAALPCEGDRPLRADRDRVQQILMNLMGNAVKFSPGGARVEVAIERGEHEGNVVFVVRDFGRGIPPEQLERVFDRFHRCADEPGSAGTGLGLSICREIVVLHGGRIWAESSPGQGTTFRAEFPSPAEIRARMPRTGPVTAPLTGALTPSSLPALVRAAAAEAAAAAAGIRAEWSTTGSLPPLRRS